VAWDGGAHLKIGTSANTRRRGGELRVKMILSVPGEELQERRLQKMFAPYRIGQEWFWPGSGLIAWLHAVIDCGECRIECGECRIECGAAAEAHLLVTSAYQLRWEVAA
jgi:hypothetical protein